MQESTSDTTEDAISKYKETQEEVFDRLMDTAKDLEKMMDKLSGFVDKSGNTAETAKDTMTEGVEATNVGLNAALGIIEDTYEILKKFIP